MPLDFATQQFPFSFGLAEGVDPHHVPPGTLVTAENVSWSKSGRAEKRAGTAAFTRSIAGGGSLAAGSRLVVRGDELGLVANGVFYSYTPATGAWQNMGPIAEVGLTWTTLVTLEAGVLTTDIAVLSDGRVVHAWAAGDPTNPAPGAGATTIYYQVFDRTSVSRTTQAVALVTPAAATSFVRIVSSGTTHIIIWDDGGSIKCAVNGGTTRTLRTDACTKVSPVPLAFDACTLGSNFAIAYEKIQTAGVGALSLFLYDFSDPPVQQATGAVATETCNGANTQSFTCLGIDGSTSDNLHLAYAGQSSFSAGSNRLYYACFNPTTLAQTQGRTNIDATDSATIQYIAVGVARKDGSSCFVVYEAFDNTVGKTYVDRGVASWNVTSAAVATAKRISYGLQLLSKPFMLNGNGYVFVCDYAQGTTGSNTNQQPNSMLVDLPTTASSAEPHRLVGKIDLLVAGQCRQGVLPGVSAASSTEMIAPVSYLAAIGRAPMLTGTRLVSATVGASLPPDMWRTVVNDGDVAIVAGVFQAYDGQRPVDYGFANGVWLDILSTAGVAGGGSVAAGTYLFSLVPEYRSATGMLYRGPTLPAWSLAQPGAGAGRLRIYFVPLGQSPKVTGTAISSGTNPLKVIYAYYRTTIGGTSALYRETWDPRLNVPTPTYASSPVNFDDTRADSDLGNAKALATRPVLYTSGGELDDFQPPAFVTATKYRNRIFAIAGDRRTLWLSKDYTANVGTAPGFHPSLTIGGFPEDLTGLAVLDDKLIVFSKTSVWFFAGDGPAPNGQGSDYGTPSRVQSDVGCTTARSIVSTPDGIMFMSTRGLYLLTRGLELVWIGRAVVDELAAYPSVTSAVLYARRNEVRFTANNSGTTAGITLVFNYVEKQWSTAKYTVNGTYGAPIADACIWQDLWTFCTPDGFVVQESTSSYLDDSAWVPLTIETAWLTATGPLVFKSMRSFQLEGFSTTNHDLTLSVGFDSDTSYPETVTFLAGSPVTAIGPLEQCEITIGTRRKCQHIRFKIQDATPTNPGTYPVGTGKGPSFDMMGLEVGTKKGFAPNPATKKG